MEDKETKINFNYKATIVVSETPPSTVRSKASLDQIVYRDSLVRFYDKLSYVNDFIKDGKILMRSLDAFRNFESKRVDNGEGLASEMLIDTSRFQPLNKPKVPFALGVFDLPDIIPFDIEPNCKKIFAYCMSYLKFKDKTDIQEERIKQILKTNYITQKYAIIITDIETFLNRIKIGIESYFKSNVSMGLVEYKERTPFDYLGYQDGDLFFRSLCFQKDLRFKNEHEFRMAVIAKDCNQSEYFVSIGNCEDIAVVIDLE